RYSLMLKVGRIFRTAKMSYLRTVSLGKPGSRGTLVITLKAVFFATPADYRSWLENHYDNTTELWVGFYKTTSGKPSITWPVAVRLFRAKEKAGGFFQKQPLSYRRAAIWWVVSAKKAETRVKRLSELTRHSEQNRTVPPLTRRTGPR